MPTRARWMVGLAAVIALGLLSRAMPLGVRLWDKYLGDALYAVMVYAIGRLVVHWPPKRLAVASMAVMTAIEAFQLTGIPLRMGIWGRVLGATFAWGDLAAYAVGIALVAWFDRRGTMSR